jgi:hypothetical protein
MIHGPNVLMTMTMTTYSPHSQHSLACSLLRGLPRLTAEPNHCCSLLQFVRAHNPPPPLQQPSSRRSFSHSLLVDLLSCQPAVVLLLQSCSPPPHYHHAPAARTCLTPRGRTTLDYARARQMLLAIRDVSK